MFDHLADFSFQRNWKQAIGFYIVWLLAGIISTALVLFIYVHISGMVIMPKDNTMQANFAAGIATFQRMGPNDVFYVVLTFSTILSLLVYGAKRSFTNPIALGCVVLAVALSFGGAFYSFIPIAYLTTLPKSSS